MSIATRRASAERSKKYRKNFIATDEFRAKEAKRQRLNRLVAKEELQNLRDDFSSGKRQNERLKQMVESLESKVFNLQNQLDYCHLMLAELHEQRLQYLNRVREDEELKRDPWGHWHENPFVQRIKMEAVRCKEAIGYSWEEFQQLHAEFGPLIRKCRVGAFSEGAWRVTDSERTSVHPSELLLFVTLFWCRTGISEGLISAFLPPIHQRDVIRFALQTLQACGPKLREEIRFPSSAEHEHLMAEMESMHSVEFSGYTAAVDGTETRVRRGYEDGLDPGKGPREQ